jgi:REP element-mobilizing transposase RayT
VQLTFDEARRIEPGKHGGWRPGSGRPRSRTGVAHEKREEFKRDKPQHVTLRVAKGVPNLRKNRVRRIVSAAIRAGGHSATFRVVHYAILGNHLHLITEAQDTRGLARGMQGLCVRLARRINLVLSRRGALFGDRYHARVLKTPREVRNAIRYVLLNERKHCAERGEKVGKYWVDPFSSGYFFDGWKQQRRFDEPWQKEILTAGPATAPPTVWLLTTGWRRHGLIAFDEVAS